MILQVDLKLGSSEQIMFVQPDFGRVVGTDLCSGRSIEVGSSEQIMFVLPDFGRVVGTDHVPATRLRSGCRNRSCSLDPTSVGSSEQIMFVGSVCGAKTARRGR